MLPDRVSNPGPLTYESGALPIALRGPACGKLNPNRSMNEGSRTMTMFFLKIATVTLTLAYHNYWSNPESDL